MRPNRDEAAEYYFRYIDQVPDGEILGLMDAQRGQTLALWRDIREDQAGHRYAATKWTIRQVAGHVNDTERLFVSRALWFARGFEAPLPSFDQNVAIASADFDSRTWTSLVDEFDAVRASTIAFFRGLPPGAWDRRGTASGNPFSVRALAFLTAGHVIHHNTILRERYLGRP